MMMNYNQHEHIDIDYKAKIRSNEVSYHKHHSIVILQ